MRNCSTSRARLRALLRCSPCCHVGSTELIWACFRDRCSGLPSCCAFQLACSVTVVSRSLCIASGLQSLPDFGACIANGFNHYTTRKHKVDANRFQSFRIASIMNVYACVKRVLVTGSNQFVLSRSRMYTHAIRYRDQGILVSSDGLPPGHTCFVQLFGFAPLFGFVPLIVFWSSRITEAYSKRVRGATRIQTQS